MQTLPATKHGAGDPFAATQWSVVLAAGKGETDPENSRVAVARLCETYWPPLYTYVRAHGYSMHDAQDLTQGFFAHLLEKKIYARSDRAKGKFRSFLLASLKNFLCDARDRAHALKRGGDRAFVPLHEIQLEAAESLFHTHVPVGSRPSADDQLFERTWAETLLTTVLDQLAAAYEAQGQAHLFHEISVFLTIGAAPLPTYPELAARLALTESTLRSHVTRLRARYRELLRSEVRRTVDNEVEVEGELRELLRVLSEA